MAGFDCFFLCCHLLAGVGLWGLSRPFFYILFPRERPQKIMLNCWRAGMWSKLCGWCLLEYNQSEQHHQHSPKGKEKLIDFLLISDDLMTFSNESGWPMKLNLKYICRDFNHLMVLRIPNSESRSFTNFWTNWSEPYSSKTLSSNRLFFEQAKIQDSGIVSN